VLVQSNFATTSHIRAALLQTAGFRALASVACDITRYSSVGRTDGDNVQSRTELL